VAVANIWAFNTFMTLFKCHSFKHRVGVLHYLKKENRLELLGF
jgi:hypothetical protein